MRNLRNRIGSHIPDAILLFFLILAFTSSCAKKEVDEIRIGVIAPLSGPSAKYGQDIKRGYDLAVSEINDAGGIRGRNIILVYEDSEGTPEIAVSAAHKLIKRDRVIAILGALWSSPTLAVAPIVEQAKVVLLSSGSSSPKITEAGDYIFRNEVSDEYGARESANLYLKENYNRIGILYVNNDYGVGVRDVTQRVYHELGGEVLIAEAFEQDAKDFRTQLLKIAGVNPEAILIVGYKEAILILRQLGELGIHLRILGTPLFQDAEIIEKAGNVAEGALYSYYGTFDLMSESPDIARFVKSFKERYNADSGYYAPIGYDALMIIAQALETAGTNSKDIKEALYSIKKFPGVSGITSFDENGDVIKPVVLKTIKGGKFQFYDD